MIALIAIAEAVVLVAFSTSCLAAPQASPTALQPDPIMSPLSGIPTALWQWDLYKKRSAGGDFSGVSPRGDTCLSQDLPFGKPVRDCPKKNKVNDKGVCPPSVPKASQNTPPAQLCNAYCEESVTKIYGTEIPLIRLEGYKGYPRVCDGRRTECSLKGPINVQINNALHSPDEKDGLLDAFNLGSSFIYQKSLIGQFETTTAAPKECVYWTFIPYYIESWGTLSQAKVETNVCKKDKITNHADFCVKTYDLNNPGIELAVKVDCETQKLLPMDKQDPIYGMPGVAGGWETAPNT